MSETKFKGSPVRVAGEFITAGAEAPAFELVKSDLSPLRLSDLKGKRVVLNIFPSLDTSVCATSVRKFNQLAAQMDNTVVLAVSKDRAYGVLMADGPLAGLLARAVVVIDKAGRVVYTELVPEITEEPDYDKAVEAVKAN